MEIPLNEYNYKQNKASFLESVIKYSKKWYDYDLEVIDILREKIQLLFTIDGRGQERKMVKYIPFQQLNFIISIKKRNRLIE